VKRLCVQVVDAESISTIWKTSFRRIIGALIADVSLEDSGLCLSANYANPKMSSASDNSGSPVGISDHKTFS
jgi:hypothetical protein